MNFKCPWRAFRSTRTIPTANTLRTTPIGCGRIRITEEEDEPAEPPQFPIGTIAYYGPDDKTTTKIVAGVIKEEGAEAIIKRWVATDVTTNPKVQKEIDKFFKKHGVKQVGMTEGNLGCPHEEGKDFPDGRRLSLLPVVEGKTGKRGQDVTPKRRLFHRHDQIPRLIFPLHVYDRSIRIRPLLYGYPRHGPWAAWAISASNIGLVFAQAGPPWLWVLCCWPAARPAPWPWSHSDSPAKPASNDAKTTSPTSPKSSASQTDAEALKQVMAELQQVGALDPAAQDKLMADLKQVDPSLWPMVLQTFRAEAAYKRREEQREAGRKKEESTAASTPREGGGAITQVSSEQETRFELNSA